MMLEGYELIIWMYKYSKQYFNYYKGFDLIYVCVHTNTVLHTFILNCRTRRKRSTIFTGELKFVARFMDQNPVKKIYVKICFALRLAGHKSRVSRRGNKPPENESIPCWNPHWMQRVSCWLGGEHEHPLSTTLDAARASMPWVPMQNVRCFRCFNNDAQ